MIDLLDEIADIIQPIPVVAFDLQSDTVIAVNDSRWHISAPSGSSAAWSSAVTRQPFTHATAPIAPVTYRTIEASLQQNEPSRFARAERAPGTQGSGKSQQDQGQSPSGSTRSPEIPPEPAQGEMPKFMGILDLEDDAGLHQQIKITLNVKITSSGFPSGKAITTSSIIQPAIVLPRTVTASEEPYLRCTHFTMTVGIDDKHKIDYESQLSGQSPRMYHWVSKVSSAGQHGASITGNVGMSPSISASYASATTYTKDYTPLQTVINFDRAIICERSDTKEHIWQYAFQKNANGQVDFVDDYVSRVQYRLASSLDEIRLCFDAVLENNNKQRLRWLQGKRNSILTCWPKHVIMKYRLKFRRKGEMIEFYDGGWVTPLSQKVEALPRVEVWGKEETGDKVTAQVGMEMERKVRMLTVT